MLDLCIQNAQVVNGKNEEPYWADVGIVGDTIVQICPKDGPQCVTELQEKPAKRVIDAKGRTLTPGFIDIHCHSDAITFHPQKNPLRLRQGFTTEVIGNCGLGAAPVNPKYREQLRTYNNPYFSNIPIPYTWTTFDGYLQALQEQQPLLNTAALVGHGALRAAISGFENRQLTQEELEQMKGLLRESLEAGAFGMSTGLIYPPGTYANDQEILQLAKVVQEYDGLYSTHMRNESFHLVEAVQETLHVARETGVNTEISHHKAAGKKNFGKTAVTLDMIQKANEEGLRVHCDVYPYDASSTQFSAVLPPWALSGGVDALLERLGDPQTRSQIIADIKKEPATYENFYLHGGWDKILINECSVEEYVGKTVEQIAQEKGRDPFEMALDIIKDSSNNVMMIVFLLDEKEVASILKHPCSMVCTDGFPSFGRYHPRYIGSFVRVLEKYVKQEQLLTLPQAVYKMTGMPARKLGLSDRGVVEEGAKADLLLLDLPNVADHSDYLHHNAPATGVDYVIINGTIAVDEGVPQDVCAGKVLRRR